MPHKILPAAQRAIKDIWKYTEARWGAQKADAYVYGLYEALDRAAENRKIWRPVRHPGFAGIFFVRHEHHYLFFRELSDGSLGLISILHEKMDIPHRLRDDLEAPDAD